MKPDAKCDKTNYSYVAVPNPPTSTDISRYRTLRLAALLTSPSSFSADYATEAAFSDEVWRQRLSRVGMRVFACVVTAVEAVGGAGMGEERREGEVGERGESGEWVAIVTVRGLLVREGGLWGGNEQDGGEEEESEGDATGWQVLSLWVDVEHRGKGLAGGVCGAAGEWAARQGKEEGRGKERGCWVRAMIKPDNGASLGLVRKMGFEVWGRCTLREAVVANGDVVPVGWEGEREKWEERSGWVLGRKVER